MQELLENLNPAQKQAVTADLGAVLVLAGAGSGKTTVLTRRNGFLLKNFNAYPSSIFCVTFTNKAALEMKERNEKLLKNNTQGMWIGTFHGLSHRLLRLHPTEAGLNENFRILDSDDQFQILKKMLKQRNLSDEKWDPRKIQGYIGRLKDNGVRAKQMPPPKDLAEKLYQSIYQEYEAFCMQESLIDFAELLLRSYELLKNNTGILNLYQQRFKHFLIDEFQDTNGIQYEWIKLLAGQAQSVMAVGDDDQSIYGWRGARVENIQRFVDEFSNTKIIKLEQNYRSTKTILEAANQVIENNQARLGKTLWSAGESGEKIGLYEAYNEDDEAIFVARRIKEHLAQGFSPSKIAVLYRSNAQSRVLEDAFIRASIPYAVYGGFRFFERAEIKDALAYLRLIVNPEDNAAFERVINVPHRGLGDKSLEKLGELARERGVCLWQALDLGLNLSSFSGRVKSGLEQFKNIILELQILSESLDLSDLIGQLIIKTGLLEFYQNQKTERSEGKTENLKELVNAAADFNLEDESMQPLLEFLAYTSLESGDKQSKDTEAVTLMTLHASKGLEFPIVFITGLEENLFPHQLSKDKPESLQEERRLFYVGITRAMKKLYLSHAFMRKIFGREELRRKSSFLEEITPELLEEVNKSKVVKSPVKSTSYSSGFGLSSGFGQKSVQKPIQKSEQGMIGKSVKHPKFGMGKIIDQEGQGERSKINVDFKNFGNKWLLLTVANVEFV
ncbi:MAG: 3'-5' exonuclease [Gammaproteobacteria bacterium]